MHRSVSQPPRERNHPCTSADGQSSSSPRSSSQASPWRPRSRRRAARRRGKTFYYIPKDTLNPYEVIADHGGKLALTELGDTQVVSSGTEDTAAAQQPAIQAAIQSHAAGIVIAGNDPQAVCPALQQAQAQGTKIVAFDSDVNCRQLFINQADTETIGRSQIQLLGQADALQGSVRDSVRGLDGHEPERVDQVHEARAEEADLQEHEAREDLLRQRQPGPVAAGDGEHAAGVPEPEGDRVADDGRDLLGRAVPLDLEVQEEGRAHGPRPAEPDEDVRPQRHGEGVRSSGTPRISGTSPATRSPRSPTARSRARSARRSRPASSARTRSSRARTESRRSSSDRRTRSPSRTSTSSSSRTGRGGAASRGAPSSPRDRDDNASRPVLSLEHAQKSFGAVHALEDGDIELLAGEVHGLVGENGAGKSTLVKILAGVHRPDAGRLVLDGEEAIFDNAKQSQAAGIAIIFQEPTLFPDLTVAENIFVGVQPLKRFRRIDGRRMRREAAAVFEQLGVAARPRPAGARAVDRRPAARRDREGADDERARDRDGRADGRADDARRSTGCSASSRRCARTATRCSSSRTGSKRSSRSVSASP